MKTIRNITKCFSLFLMVALVLTSCDKYNYTDKLQGLGTRVEILEAMVLEANTNIEALNEIIHAINKRGFITNVVKNTDGSYTITFNTGNTYTLRDGRKGADGKDGKDTIFQIGAEQDPTDGIWYWTVNGQWLLDNNGNKVRAGAVDGKDGKDGKTGQIYVPQVRINPYTLNWEISTDGGSTWTDTGFYAAGKDGTDGSNGTDGRNGKNGEDDMFQEIIPAADGSSITFVLRDGRTFTVPITK